MNGTDPQLLCPTPPSRVLWDVAAEHLDEAEFVIEQRAAALRSPRFTLDDLEHRFETRLAAHLDALAVGGPAVADRLLYPELERALSPERAIAAALVLLAGGRDDWHEVLEAATFADTGKQRRALLRALALHDAPHFETILLDAFEYARSGREKATLMHVAAARHLDPGPGLAECLEARLSDLTTAAVRAAGNAGRRDLTGAVERHLEAADPGLRRAAIEAGLALDSSPALRACRDVAGSSEPGFDRALLLLTLAGTAEDHRRAAVQLDREAARGPALFALGFAGTAEAVEACLPWMASADARTAKLAAEAVSAITGFIPPARRPETPDAEALPDLDDDLDATLLPDPIDAAPLPDHSAAAEWWEANRGRFSPKERYLRGTPWTPEAQLEVLWTAPLRRRHALALELSIRSGGKRFVDTGALAERQRRQLRALEADLKGES